MSNNTYNCQIMTFPCIKFISFIYFIPYPVIFIYKKYRGSNIGFKKQVVFDALSLNKYYNKLLIKRARYFKTYTTFYVLNCS